MKDEIFPLIIIVLQVLAAIPYAFHLDYKMTLYWVAAAVINICATF